MRQAFTPFATFLPFRIATSAELFLNTSAILLSRFTVIAAASWSALAAVNLGSLTALTSRALSAIFAVLHLGTVTAAWFWTLKFQPFYRPKTSLFQDFLNPFGYLVGGACYRVFAQVEHLLGDNGISIPVPPIA